MSMAEVKFNSVVARVFGDRYTESYYDWYPVSWNSFVGVRIGYGRVIDLLCSHSTYGLARVYHGDRSQSSSYSYSATYEFDPLTIPTIKRLSYTPLNLRV